MNTKIALKLQKYKPENREKIDSVLNSIYVYEKDKSVLDDAHRAWNSLDEFRQEAYRNEQYVYGDQWHEKVLVDGKYISERQHIINQGSVPLQNNRMRGAIRTIVSLFSANVTEPVCVVRDSEEQGLGDVMSSAIQYVHQINETKSLDPVQLQYGLVSGLVAYYTQYGNIGDTGKQDVSQRVVNYNNIFFDNHIEDPRHWDNTMVGEIHDMGLYDVISKFAKSKEQAGYIRQIYRHINPDVIVSTTDTITKDQKINLDFYIPKDSTRCRVIEVWRKECKERIRVIDRLKGDIYKVEIEEEGFLETENKKRIKEQLEAGVLEENLKLLEYEWILDSYWHFWYLSPMGDVLMKGETPYEHKSHPYSFRISPFFNGKVRPFVNEFIDQQRILNRYIITQDFITRHSAKGVLMMPEDSIPDTMTMDEIADEWTKVGGMILYKAKAGVQPPTQVTTASSSAGLFDMINLQLKMFEDISGVQGALQGQSPKSGTPASLFAQQVQNSATALTEVFNSFRDLRQNRDWKILKLIQQYYDTARYINLVGQDSKNIFYEPSKIADAEIDLSIVESPSTPAYRMVINDMLSNLNAQGQITLEEMLQAGSFPFKEKLLALLAKRQQSGEQINAEQLINEAQQ